MQRLCHAPSSTTGRRCSYSNWNPRWIYAPKHYVSTSHQHAEGLPALHKSFKDSRLRLSQFWIATGSRSLAAGEEDATHQLLLKGGFLRQAHAGVFQILPLGLRVQKKAERLIDRHMQQLGAHKLALSSITSEALWTKSGRFTGANSELFSLHGEKRTGLLLSPTHEEEITQLVSGLVTSYKDLPLRLYQIGPKYRNELRPRRGLLRAREFFMKDLYTFDTDNESALATYEDVKAAYIRIFDELRIPYKVVEADSGAMGGSLSHEFQCVGVNGEDTIVSCRWCNFAANEEIFEHTTASSQSGSLKDGSPCPHCQDGTLVVQKAIELGHTFHLGTRYSIPFEALVELPTSTQQEQFPEVANTKSSNMVPMVMGCHGIGVSRLIAAVAESLKDSVGLTWPRAIAPFDVLVFSSPGLQSDAERLYDALTSSSVPNVHGRFEQIEAVLDDRDKGIGWKFNDAELLGVPVLVFLGRAWKTGVRERAPRKAEVHCRRLLGKPVEVPEDELVSFVETLLKDL